MSRAQPLRGVDETTPLLGCEADEFFDVMVYPLVHEIRVDIVAHIDTPLTYDQLIAPDSTYTIIRPLVEKYLTMRNPSVVFCLLLNKVQFISDSHKLSIATLSESRAMLCEVLATRVLRGWSERSLPLATVLLTSWRMFQGAPQDVVNDVRDEGEEEVLENSGTALEMAIISSSKRFIRSASCQKVIEGIWSGKIIYSSYNEHALIKDNYKKRPIQIYNPHTAPLLDHYRLKVPKIRSLLEYVNFLVLFVLYVIAIEQLQTQHITGWEVVFMVYAVAFSVDKLAATREHGMKVFASSLVNGFDLLFVIIFLASFFARVYGTAFHNMNAMGFGADLLALGAVLIFPRLVFMTLANNLMILSIRSMLAEFFFLMSVGIICFLGFLYALYTLGEGRYKPSEITWWLLEIYFGLDATGFLTSSKVHPFLGPVLMVIYAFLSNTLLLTVAVAILGNTFAIINADAGAESMFRKAVATIEGVKADSVFSYQLPFNLIALMFLFPLKFVLNPRWFHKVNVAMIRVTNLPVLLIIALYERQTYSNMSVWEQICDYTDHYVGKITAAAGFEGFVGARMDVSAVFEVEREFGTFYQGWEDEHNMNDDCVILDDEEDIDGAVQATVTESPELAASPTQTNFHSASSKDSSNNVISPRRRRSSLSAILNPVTMGVPAVVPAAPLPSARLRGHSQIPGPSPLAQLFVRPPDERRPMLPVGSMPVTSSFLSGLSGSPRRTRPSFGATGSSMSAGGGPGTSGISVSLSTSSLASAPSAAGGAGGGSRALVRPSITPIQEDPTSLSSSVADLGEWAPSQSAPATSTTTTSPTASNSPTQRAKKPETHFPTDASSSTGDVSSSNITSPVTLGVGRRRAASADSTSTVSPMTASLQLPPPTIVEPLNEDKEKKSERRPPTSDRSERSERSERSDRPDRPESKKDRDREKLGRGGGTGAVPSPRIKPSTSGSVPGLKASAACKMPKTASELLESLEAAGAADQDAAANVATIAKIAERQARIEALLEQLLAAQVHSHSHSHAHAGAAAGHALGFGHTSHTSHAGHTHTSHGHHTGHAGHAGHGHGHGTHRTSTSRHASDTGTGTTSTSTSTPSTDAASGNAQHNTQHNIRARTCAPRPDEVYDTLQDLE